MNENDFLTRMKKILDSDDVSMDNNLEDIEEWDSLSVVSYAAMANAVGKNLTFKQIRDCLTLRDLYNLLQ